MPQQFISAAPFLSQPAGRVECRVYERIPCDLPSYCHPAMAFSADEPRWSARIRNISQGGVCIVLKRRYERGAALAIELPCEEGQPPNTYFAKVVYARPENGGLWAMGCQFVRPLGEEEVRRLLEIKEPASHLAKARIQFLDENGSVVRSMVTQLRVSKSWPLPPGKTLTIRGGEASPSPWAYRVQVIQCQQASDGCWILKCRLLDSAASAESP